MASPSATGRHDDAPTLCGVWRCPDPLTPTHVSADMKTVQVKAKVTNTGKKYSGKQVVHVHLSAPAGPLDQPY